MKIVLASSSPRRKELLQTAGINFEIDVEGVDEVPQGDTPEEKVCSIAAQKCRPVAVRRPNDCVIGADTVVSVDGDILGKPHDREDAKNMLCRLSCQATKRGTAVERSETGRNPLRHGFAVPPPPKVEALARA